MGEGSASGGHKKLPNFWGTYNEPDYHVSSREGTFQAERNGRRLRGVEGGGAASPESNGVQAPPRKGGGDEAGSQVGL